MKNNLLSTLTFSGALILAVACGGDSNTLSKQKNQRAAIEKELQGSWISNCESSTITSLIFTPDSLDVERVYFFDSECVDKSHTVRHQGSYTLANNYKEGRDNSIIFVPSKELRVTSHTTYQVDAINKGIQDFKKASKERTIDPKATPAERSQITRENAKLKAVTNLSFKVDEEKTLSNLAVEQLVELRLLSVKPAAEFGSRTAFRYEFDNNNLQLGGVESNRVYLRK